MMGKGIQMVRTPGVLGLGFPHLSGPVKHLSFLHCPPPCLLHSTSCLTRGSGERQQVQQQRRGSWTRSMWVSQPFPTSCTASPSRRGLTSHSWWQVWGFWRRWVLQRPWLSSDLTNWACLSTGESGLGKSTLINSLFLTNLYEDRQLPEASARLTQTLTIERRGVEIEEGGIKVKLTLVDTPGFGDSVDCSDCWLPVVRFIEEQFEQYLRDESGLNRKNIQDSRVHCCLYFISPFGRGLRPLDVAFLRAVHEKVNIIPVIGKADALMPRETQALKQKLKEEEINIYQFPDCDSDEDEDFKRQDAEMKESIPFAVVGSCEVVRDKGTRPVRGRRYSWGTVEVENPHHCDFLNLRRMLVQTHLQDLKEVTHDLLYEGYRARCLQSLARPGARDRASRSKLSRRSTTEIPLPMLPLAETEKLIREKDEELRRMQEMLEKMQAQVQQSQAQVQQSQAQGEQPAAL
ncbi:PREDICTED: septin-1 isoform X2 [Myotis davidii]|uniref:septin-1 isoform X2 n=1 Tax=Myotis davidii TaxID=225400 RepID=UPI0007679032|nr:PREDICTED: septin-1 isoform X2 [Myotis davidii]